MANTTTKKANPMMAGLVSGTRAPDEALRALAQLSGAAKPAAPAEAEAEVLAEDADFNPAPPKRPAAKAKPAPATKAAPAGRPLAAERPLSFEVTMNPKELRKQLGVRVLQSIQMRLKKATILGQLSGEGPQTAQEIVEAALVEYLDKMGH